MYTRVPGSGLPIGSGPSIRAGSETEWLSVNVVFSVGPYPLVSTRFFAKLNAAATPAMAAAIAVAFAVFRLGNEPQPEATAKKDATKAWAVTKVWQGSGTRQHHVPPRRLTGAGRLLLHLVHVVRAQS